MGKRLQKVLGVLLAGCMVVGMAGCSSSGTTENAEGGKTEQNGQENTAQQAKGRYVEKMLETPQGYQGGGYMTVAEDGTFTIIDINSGTIDVSTDYGDSWEVKEDEKLVNLLMSEGMEITSAAVTPDGSYFISYVPWTESSDDKMFPEKYYYRTPDGSEYEFELGVENYQTSIMQLAFTKNGAMYALYSSGNVYKIDLSAQAAEKCVELEGIEKIFSANDSVVAIGTKQTYERASSESQFTQVDDLLNDYINTANVYPNTVIIGADSNSQIYAASREGIYTHVADGTVMEEIADGALTTLSDPSNTPCNIFVLEDGSIVILYADGSLFSYTYDAEASVTPENQLTIYSLSDNDTIRQAISSFRKNHPDFYVKMEVGMSENDGITENDAIKNLNTELLSGEGPDLIILDGMPIDSYVEKGMLMDLSDVVSDLEKENQYFDGIFKAYTKNENTYALPIRFSIPLLFGKQNEIKEITDIATLADAVEKIAAQSTTEETVLGTYTPEETLTKLYALCSNTWYNEDGSINKDHLTAYLTQAKQIYDAEQQHLTDSKIEEHQEMVVDFPFTYAKNRYYQMVGFGGSYESVRAIEGFEQIAAGWYSDISDFQTITSICNMDSNYAYQLWEEQSQKVFLPMGIIGISANSKQADSAKEFIKVLLGTEIQGKDLHDGFPVNKDAMESFCTNPYPDGMMGMGGDDIHGNEVIIDLPWPTTEEFNKLTQIIEQLNTPYNHNAAMKEEVVSIGKNALSGEKEINECVEEICQKLTLQAQE